MNDKKSKLLYIIGATIFTLIIITICLISILQKPYKKYENHIYLNYNVDIVDGKTYYTLNYDYGNNAYVGTFSYKVAEKNVDVYYVKTEPFTLKTTYIKAFTIDMYYDENNFKVIRLNEVPKKIKDLVVDTK